jgi:hypothetical protein
MTTWTPAFDIRSIPDAVLLSEAARRNARKRRSYTGGVVWAAHNPKTKRCRCQRCIDKRATRRALWTAILAKGGAR